MSKNKVASPVVETIVSRFGESIETTNNYAGAKVYEFREAEGFHPDLFANADVLEGAMYPAVKVKPEVLAQMAPADAIKMTAFANNGERTHARTDVKTMLAVRKAVSSIRAMATIPADAPAIRLNFRPVPVVAAVVTSTLQ